MMSFRALQFPFVPDVELERSAARTAEGCRQQSQLPPPSQSAGRWDALHKNWKHSNWNKNVTDESLVEWREQRKESANMEIEK